MGPEVEWASLRDDPGLATTAATIERDVAPFLAELTQAPRARLSATAPDLSFIVHVE